MSASFPSKYRFGQIDCSPHDVPMFLGELRALLNDSSLSPRTVLCVNAHIYNQACRDADLRDRLKTARICAADGMSIVWSARLCGAPARGRCNMTDAFNAYLNDASMPGIKAALAGCSEGEARRAAERVHAISSHCRIVASCSGFLGDEEYRRFFSSQTGVEMILLGMGTPRSEQVAEMAAEICPRAVIWHIGGGTIRILAGTMTEAPAFWRRAGLQWLHRLLTEPGKLWARYLVGNPLFLMRILSARIRGEIGGGD